jgi:CheY-like chemotaxis protein
MARILIIDDDDALRRTLRKMLQGMGHEIMEASGGQEGVELFRADGADLVISDLIMPNQDGIETIIALREEQPDLKILAVSGAGRTDPGERLTDAMLLGADASLLKPFKMPELRETVARLLASGSEKSAPTI